MTANTVHASFSRDATWQSAAEFRLLQLCAQSRLSPESQGSVVELLARLDWDRLLVAAVDQGMLPLLRRRLPPRTWEKAPLAARDHFAEAARRATAQALLLASSLPRILSWLQDAAIVAVPFKGPALAFFLYGDVTLRQMFDLDLLVAARDVPRAQQVLRDHGFSPSFPVPASAEPEMLRNECESSFDSADGSYAVELHWQIAPRLYGINLPAEGLLARSRLVPFERRQVLALAPEDQVVALCAHAAKHAYRKLGWIADLAQCLRVDRELDWDLLRARSHRARARRVLAVGLELAAAILEAPVPAEVRRSWRSERAVVDAAARVRRDYMPEAESEVRLARHLFHLRLCDGWRQRLGYAAGLFLTPTMAERTSGGHYGSAARLAHSLSRIFERGCAAAAGKAGSGARL